MNVRHAAIRLPIGTAVLCALAAGCTSDTPETEPSRATSTASSTPSVEVSAATTPPTAPLPRAADGSNLDACEDGRCEVLVDKATTIPIDARRLDVDGLRVESIEQDTVKLAVIASELYSFSTDGDSSRIVSQMGLTPGATGPAGTVVTANRLRVEVVAVANGAAVLRLTPA